MAFVAGKGGDVRAGTAPARDVGRKAGHRGAKGGQHGHEDRSWK